MGNNCSIVEFDEYSPWTDFFDVYVAEITPKDYVGSSFLEDLKPYGCILTSSFRREVEKSSDIGLVIAFVSYSHRKLKIYCMLNPFQLNLLHSFFTNEI